MTEQGFAILLASAFTFGCAAIHEGREHARHLTPILASITTGLAFLAGMIALAESGPVSLPAGDMKSGLRAERTQRQQPRLGTMMTEVRIGSAELPNKAREGGDSEGRAWLGENRFPQKPPTLEEQNAANRTKTTVKHSLKRGLQETERTMDEK